MRAEDETVWLTQAQMALLFETTRNNVTLHIGNIFREGELDAVSVCKDSLLTASDGKAYKTKMYNLDVIISVCYRVKSFQDGNSSRRFVTALNPALEQKKTTLTDAAKIKAVNKQINVLQEEYGRLRKLIQDRRSYFNKQTQTSKSEWNCPRRILFHPSQDRRCRRL